MMRALPLVVALAGMSCSPVDGLVVVTVTAQHSLTLYALRGTAALDGKVASFTVPLAAPSLTLPPAKTFGLRVPGALGGTLHVHVDALDAKGTVFASADQEVTVGGGKRAATTLTLDAGNGSGPDMGVGSSDMSTTCMPACTNPSPICENATATCRTCTGSSECAAQQSGLPACVSGQCRQCAANSDCIGAQKTCDTSTNSCVPCTQSSDCASKLCESGSCVDPTTVVYVDVAGPSCPAGPGKGTLADPFCRLQAGMDAGAAAQRRVIVLPGTYGESVTAQPSGGPYMVTLVGIGSPVISPVVAGPVFRVLSDGSNAVSLTMDGFTIENAHTPDAYGIQCVGATGSALLTKLSVSHLLLQNNATTDINAQFCAVTIRDSRFMDNNMAVGVAVVDSVTTMTNDTLVNPTNGISSSQSLSTTASLTLDNVSVIGAMGDGLYLGNDFTVTNTLVADAQHMGVRVYYPGKLFAFNTVVNNGATLAGQPWGVGCYNMTGGPVPLVSSIIVGNGKGNQTNGGAIMNTQIDGNCTLTNVVTGADNATNAIQKTPVFVASGATTPHDYHLKVDDPANVGANGCCVDKIAPAAGLPTHDIDNQTRPLGAGLDIGADEAQ